MNGLDFLPVDVFFTVAYLRRAFSLPLDRLGRDPSIDILRFRFTFNDLIVNNITRKNLKRVFFNICQYMQ